MKKKLYLIFGLLMSLLLIGVVKADGLYHLEWETEPDEELMTAANVQFKDGYLVADYNYDGLVLRTFSKAGEPLKEKEISDVTLLDMITKDNDIYVLLNKNQETYIYLYNENLQKQGQEQLDFRIPITMAGADYIRVNETGVAVQDAYSKKIYIYERDLSDFTAVNYTNKKAKAYYPEYAILDDIEFYNKYFYYYGYANGTLAVGGMQYNENKCGADLMNNDYKSPQDGDKSTSNQTPYIPYDTECYDAMLYAFNEDAEELWHKKLSGYRSVVDVKVIDDYVAAIVMGEEDMDILFYDLEGKQIQKITSTSGFTNIVDTDRGFIVAQGYCIPAVDGANNNGPIIPKGQDKAGADACCAAQLGGTTGWTVRGQDDGECVINHQIYYLYRDISSNITGKGSVEVMPQQKPGEDVTFVVTPDEGYVIGVIKVTDTNGNVLTFTDNTFTMPSADVTIEVEFVVANAKTADIAIATIAIIAAISAVIVFVNKKQLNKVA